MKWKRSEWAAVATVFCLAKSPNKYILDPTTSLAIRNSTARVSIHSTDDAILSLLHARFRHLIVNPFKHIRNLDDKSQREYKACCYDAMDAKSVGQYESSGSSR